MDFQSSELRHETWLERAKADLRRSHEIALLQSRKHRDATIILLIITVIVTIVAAIVVGFGRSLIGLGTCAILAAVIGVLNLSARQHERMLRELDSIEPETDVAPLLDTKER